MNEQAKENMALFLESFGIDLKQQGMEKTPTRVAMLYSQLFEGVGKSTCHAWGEVFPTEYEGLVSVMNIPFYSMCEHHLMPFYGMVDIIYQPTDGKVAGLSKFGDVINILARRPQLQERLTNQIADAIENELGAAGVLVRVTGTHLCMLIRGDMQQGTQTVTLEGRGVLGVDGAPREEAFAIMGGTTSHV